MRYADRHQAFAGKVIISYPLRWGGSFSDHRLWMAELDGEVLDYDSKSSLIADAKSKGLGVVVLRVHRDGSASATTAGRAGEEG